MPRESQRSALHPKRHSLVFDIRCTFGLRRANRESPELRRHSDYPSFDHRGSTETKDHPGAMALTASQVQVEIGRKELIMPGHQGLLTPLQDCAKRSVSPGSNPHRSSRPPKKLILSDPRMAAHHRPDDRLPVFVEHVTLQHTASKEHEISERDVVTTRRGRRATVRQEFCGKRDHLERVVIARSSQSKPAASIT